MADFTTSLMREKFVIQPDDKTEDPIVALSNRISIHLISEDKIDDEIFIIRTQNMHSCARLAALIVKEFYERGTIANRAVPVKWETIWNDVIKGYERNWNPNIWAVIYHKGRPIFQDGTHHPFLDIIEQCDIANQGEYAESIQFAEEAFSTAGKKVNIEYDSSIALIVSSSDKQAKCGIIVRAASGTTTFNYISKPLEAAPKPLHVHTTLTVAAAYLESIQLAFQVGLMNKKTEFNLIKKFSDEERRHERTRSRLHNLGRAIESYENSFHVVYRPDRPVFAETVKTAEEFSMKILKTEIEAKLEAGAIDSKDWVL